MKFNKDNLIKMTLLTGSLVATLGFTGCSTERWRHTTNNDTSSRYSKDINNPCHNGTYRSHDGFCLDSQ